MLTYHKYNLDIKLSVENLQDGDLVMSTQSEKFSECCSVESMMPKIQVNKFFFAE